MRAALTALLLAAAAATAQITGPTEVKIPQGSKNNDVLISVNADKAESTTYGDVELIPTATATRLRVRVLTADVGEGYIIVAAVKNGDLLPLFKCHVIVYGTLPPGPGPGPTPIPPGPGPTPVPPVDPAVQAVLDAATSDGTSKAELAALASTVQAAAKEFKAGLTQGRVHDLVKGDIAQGTVRLKANGRLLVLIESTVDPILKNLKTNADQTLPFDAAAAGASTLNSLADLLTKASK